MTFAHLGAGGITVVSVAVVVVVETSQNGHFSLWLRKQVFENLDFVFQHPECIGITRFGFYTQTAHVRLIKLHWIFIAYHTTLYIVDLIRARQQPVNKSIIIEISYES